jgi:glutaredoxin
MEKIRQIFKINLYISLLLGVLSLVNYTLTISGSALCKTEGCMIASSILSIDKQYVYLFAGTFAFFLAYISFSIIESKNKKNEKFCILEIFRGTNANVYTMLDIFSLLIIPALIFEVVLFSFLTITTSSFCIVCFSTLLLLLSMFILTISVIMKETKLQSLFLSIAIIFPIVLALNILELPKSKAVFPQDKYVLFQDKDCLHCKKVKDFLKQEHISYGIANAKEFKEKHFLMDLNLETIPVLLEKTETGFTIINGEQNIIDHFKKNTDTTLIYKEKIKSNQIKIKESIIRPTEDIKESPFLTSIPREKDEGCKLTTTEPCKN